MVKLLTITLLCGCIGPRDSASGPGNKRTDTAPGSDTGDTGAAGGLEGTDLVQPSVWVLLDESADPFPSHRQPIHDCDPSGVHPEGDVLEIETNTCGYAVLGQSLLEDINPGDWVELLFYHTALAAVEQPAEAHVFLSVDGNTVWERSLVIPAAAEVYIVPQQVSWSAEAGTPVRLHLHNHGGNSYRLAYLKKVPAP